MQLTIKSTTNNFTTYIDQPFSASEITLLGAVINFPTSTMPSEIYIYCDKIDSEKRMLDGKRNTLLAVICRRTTNQISFDSKQKITVPLSSAVAIGSLTFSLKDADGKDITFSSIVLEVLLI